MIKPSFWTSYACLTEEELAEAIDQVQREADRWALEISRETGDSWQQLARLHDRLVRHVAFSWTAENHAGAALVRRSTLCQGYAQAFQLVGQKLGYAVLVIIGEAHEFCHAWNMVCLDGTWYHVDVTFDDPEPDGGDDGFVSRRYVLRSDLVMLETHRWDSSKYPDCPRDSGLNLWAGEQAANSRAQLAERLDTFLQKIDFQGGLTYRTEFFYAGQDLPDVAEWTDLVDQAMYRYRKKPACCWWAGSGLSVLSLVIKTRCDE